MAVSIIYRHLVPSFYLKSNEIFFDTDFIESKPMLVAQTLFLILQFNAYGSILLAGGILTLLLSFSLSQLKGGQVKWFIFTLFLIAVWSIAYSFELSCTTLDEILWCVRIEYIGISLLPAAWIIFVIKFIEKDDWLSSKMRVSIFAIPVATLLICWTNNFHHLLYAKASVDNTGPFPLLAVKTGVWYKVHTAFFYSMITAGSVLIIKTLKSGKRIFRIQSRLVLLAAIFPWIINIIYLSGLRPYHHLDLTPFGFIFSSFLFGISLLKFGVFNIVPIAHETIIEKMQEGVMILDEKERIEDINPAMQKILCEGLDAKNKIIGAYLIKMVPHQQELLQTILHRKNCKLEVFLSQNSSKRYFAVTTTPLFKDSTFYKGTMLLFRDVTERKKAEEKLFLQAEESKKLNALKDKLFSIIAHDLRGPLSNLVSYFNLVEEGIISEEELKESIPELTQSISKVALLTDNLLLWSRNQLNGEIMKAEDFDLAEITEPIIQLYYGPASKKDISLETSIPKNTRVFADKDMLQVIIRNLLSNAVKFTRAGGNIFLEARKIKDFVTISVKDDGIGINQKSIENLFNQNFTTSGTNNEKGTGLGLKLTKEFIEKIGGTIWVKSEENKGTTFFFTLPASKKLTSENHLLVATEV